MDKNNLLHDQDFGSQIGGVFSGIHIRTSELLVKRVEDWSRVRSKPRALRRMRRGFQQNVLYREVPSPDFVRLSQNSFVCHPAMYKILRDRLTTATEN